MNPIPQRMSIGCVGELLVQIRLLQHGVQAARPIGDSGNDLIAVNGPNFRGISVRTTTTGTYTKPDARRIYDVLAIVHLRGDGEHILLDESDIYFLARRDVGQAARNCDQLAAHRMSREGIQDLFGGPHPTG